MKYLNYLFIASLLITTSVYSQISQQTIKNIDTYLNDEFQPDKPGIIIRINRNNQKVYEKAVGLANVEKEIPLQTDLIFPIGSMTKQFTAIAILQLYEQKKLLLSDEIQKYIPSFPKKKNPITIHHLLTMTSGIPEYFDVEEHETHLITKEYSKIELINIFKNRYLDFQPGNKWGYSNSNYYLLGMIIEKVSGLNYEEYITTHFFKPLKMDESYYWFKSEIPKNRLALGYINKHGNYRLAFPNNKIHISTVFSAGGIVSTLSDLNKWNTGLQNNTFLKKKTLKKAYEDYKLLNKDQSHYGYGFFIEDFYGDKVIQHGGDLYGVATNGLFFPKQNIYMTIYSNSQFKDTKTIMYDLLHLVTEKPLPYKTIRLKSSVLKKYVGTYEFESKPSRKLKITLRNNQLFFTISDNSNIEFKLEALDEFHFIHKSSKSHCKFVLDQNKQVVKLEVNQDGIYYWHKVN